MSARWAAGLLRRLAAPSAPVNRAASPAVGPFSSPGGGRDAVVVEDAPPIRLALQGLLRERGWLTLQAPDGSPVGSAVLRSAAVDALVLAWPAGESVPPGDRPASLNAVASGRRGLLFFSLRDPTPLAAGLWQARWPDTLIQLQSRRHFRVDERMSGASLTLAGAPGRHRLRDLSENGVGVTLDGGQRPPEGRPQAAALHLGELTLPVPALQWVHGGPGAGAATGRPAGARLGGMSAAHVRQLRCWLAAHQAASPARPPDQAWASMRSKR